MATQAKKIEPEVTEVTKAPEKPTLVKIILPRIDGQAETKTVIINGEEEVIIPRGKIVEVSPAVAQVLENSMQGEADAERYQRKFRVG